MDNTQNMNYLVNPVTLPVESLKQPDTFNQTVANIMHVTSYINDPPTVEKMQEQKMTKNSGIAFESVKSDSEVGGMLTPNAHTSVFPSSHLNSQIPIEGEAPLVNLSNMSESQKRKSPIELNGENNHLAKKQLLSQLSEEKKKSNLRKNIREVMDSNQLDTNTLRAQHEESERLARMAEQQKLLREYQQREAVLTHFDRFVNAHRVRNPADLIPEQKKTVMHKLPDLIDSKVEQTASDQALGNIESEIDPIKGAEEKEDTTPAEIVTIEDSSDDDDCIVLSDEEADLEEDNDNDDPNNSGMHVKDELNVADHLGRVVINVGHPEDEEDIFIAPQIARTIKPHQIGGVRFLFDNIIESINRFKSSGGFGCILAHSMGLGKTLQVICFCDIFLRYTPSKYVVCVMPINTLQNWYAEFDMWIPKHSDNPEYIRPRHFDVFVLNDQQKTLTARSKIILQWKERGGVLLIGYELYRLLALKLSTTGKRRSKKLQTVYDNCSESRNRVMDEVYEALVKPGPDLIICDEGHRIKNAQAGISQALKQIRTRRRIVLTGYPLQNNLLEYWCMVDFVRPNYLGTRTEFCNMFERPIQNGLCIDSTPDDIKLMRYRAHVLHSLLVGFVQRRSHTVLQQSLPEKQEFVILTRMTELQKQLYDTFMNDIVRTKNVPNPLKAFAVCCKIWNHPDVLYDAMKMADSGLDWDIEEVDDLSVATSVNKNGFPPPASVSAPIAPVNTEASKADGLPTAINTLISDVENCYPSQTAVVNQNDSKEISHLTPPKTLTSAAKLTSYQGLSLFTEMNHFENPTLNTVPYNQDMQSSYFSYPTMMSTMGRPLQPNYVGCMLKQSAHETNITDDSHNSSSEIVDLDTNEIRTIETDIDMDKNISLNKDEKLDKQYTLTDNDKSETESHFGSSIGASENTDVEQKKGSEKITYDWAMKFMKKYESGVITNSPKMEIFFCILNKSVCIGDRVLLFSQSLLTLNLIEKFLQANRIPGSDSNWIYNKHYFRLDGSTTSQEREKLVNEFNSNTNVKLFLISTKAGSLGINLVGANRVIIFDASWNPCHDTQAIYRIYRYGQRRACFIYRLVMDRCLEKKIYDRQIKKQGMSDRVVDECNPDAHLSIKDVTNLCYDYDDDDDKTNTFEFIKPLNSYTDTIIKTILTDYKSCLTKEPFFHESLLIDRKNDKLSLAEKRLAHRSYEMQKKTSAKQTIYSNSSRVQYQTVRKDGSLITRPVASVRPIQAPRNQTTQKNSSGLRTTRWIPAEVWQKQGMTAQEMSLPLDVVIPTNSSNKSKIIIKAGQRVMVLKSAKGIYMQLDSGKIIAIRTLNKPNVSTTDKSDIIDITGESETASSKESPKTEKSDIDTANSPAVNESDLRIDNSVKNENGNESAEVPNEISNQLNIYNNSSIEKNVYSSSTSINTDNKPKLNMLRSCNDAQDQTTLLHYNERQQTQIQHQQQAQNQSLQAQAQQQQQNSHASHTQILNEQHLQQNSTRIQTPSHSQTQLMHSQPSAAYNQHQNYGYTQHPTLRNTSAHYSVMTGDINSYNSYPQTQYTDYPTYGSQQQSTRYHPASGSTHTSIEPAIHPHSAPPPQPSVQPVTTSHSSSLSDFYGSYYPQWSTFMLTAPTENNAHLMHSTYPPIASQPHSHSHHTKVQSTSHPWQQYHP